MWKFQQTKRSRNKERKRNGELGIGTEIYATVELVTKLYKAFFIHKAKIFLWRWIIDSLKSVKVEERVFLSFLWDLWDRTFLMLKRCSLEFHFLWNFNNILLTKEDTEGPNGEIWNFKLILGNYKNWLFWRKILYRQFENQNSTSWLSRRCLLTMDY